MQGVGLTPSMIRDVFGQWTLSGSRIPTHILLHLGKPENKSDKILDSSSWGMIVGASSYRPSGVFLALLFLFGESTENRIQSLITASK